MIKLDIEDFIYEVKEELMCYESVGKDGAKAWERGFREYLRKKAPHKKTIGLDDESVIFEIADEFAEALEHKNTDNYWKKFRI